MAAKRRSHYLSRFYMAGFTPSGKRRDLLYVTSKVQGRQWQEHAEDVAHKRDLFRPDGSKFDPDVLENGFAAIEGAVAPVLYEVIDCQALPADKERLALLLHLPALNAARPPAEIQAFEDHVDSAMRGMLLEDLTPETHATLLEAWKSEGGDPTHVQDLTSLKERIRAGGIRVKIDRNHLLAGLLQRAALLVEINLLRTWVLLVSTEAGKEFVTCDRPVPLLNNRNIPERTQPRFDDPRYDVIMPLSRNLCLVGRAQGRSGAVPASRGTVEFINAITTAGASDYVYSPAAEYPTTEGDPVHTDGAEAYLADVLRAGMDGA